METGHQTEIDAALALQQALGVRPLAIEAPNAAISPAQLEGSELPTDTGPERVRALGTSSLSEVRPTTEDLVQAEVGSRTEMSPLRAEKHVKLVRYTDETAGKGKSGELENHPHKGTLIEDARGGVTQRLTVTRLPGSTDNIHRATPGLLPAAGAELRESNEPGSKGADDIFPVWARIKRETHGTSAGDKDDRASTPAQESLEDKKDEDPGLRTKELADLDGVPYRFVLQARGVPDAENRALAGAATRLAQDVKTMESTKSLAGPLDRATEELDAGSSTATVKLDIVVGARNEEELRQVARVAAGSVLPSNTNETWTATDKNGHMELYGSEDAAIRGGATDIQSYVTAPRLGDLVRWPAKGEEIRGLPAEKRWEHAVNLRIPEGAETVKIGNILGGLDKRIGEMNIPEEAFRGNVFIGAASRAGKTYLLREMSAALAVHDYKAVTQGRLRGVIDCVPSVIVDFEKEGNFGEDFSRKLVAAGLPKEWATINTITIGAEGPRARINILRMAGAVTPSQQLDIANLLVCGDIVEPTERRVLEKFMAEVFKRLYKRVAVDVEIDDPDIDPSELFISLRVAQAVTDEVVKDETFSKEVTGNIGAFNRTEVEKRLSGAIGWLFDDTGFDVDFDKALTTPGFTVWEAGDVVDPSQKRMVASAIFLSYYFALRTGGGDVDFTKLRMYMDESVLAFQKGTKLGDFNSNVLTKSRGAGMAGVFAAQIPENVHPDVLGNCSLGFFQRSNSGADRQVIGGRMPRQFEGALERLPTIPAGAGLFFGGDLTPNGPVCFATTPDREIARAAEGYKRGPEGLLDQGPFLELYDGKVMVEARKFLLNHRNGVRIAGLAELTAYLWPRRRQPPAIAGRLKAELAAMTGDDAKKRDATLTMALIDAVAARPALRNLAKPSDLIRKYQNFLLPQIRGQEVPMLPLGQDIYYPSEHYNRAIDWLDTVVEPDAITVPGAPEIPGKKAWEQLASISRMEVNSYTAVAKAIAHTANGKDSAGDPEVLLAELGASEQHLARRTDIARLTPAQVDLYRLVGAKSLTQGLSDITARLEKAAKRPLTDAERAVLITMTGGLLTSDPQSTDGIPVGYNEMRMAVENYRAEALRTAPAQDLKVWKTFYGLDDIPGELASEQRKFFEDLAAARTAEWAERDEVVLADTLFAADRRSHHMTWDRIIDWLVKNETRLRGEVHRRQRRLYQDGRDPVVSLIESLRDNPETTEWPDTLGTTFVYNPEFILSPSSRRDLMDTLNQQVLTMREFAREKDIKKTANEDVGNKGAQK